MTDFDTALQTYIQGCQQIVDDADLSIKRVIEIVGGRRYIRIAAVEYDKEGEKIGASAHSFVDTTNGNVLKPASWKAPAKHARGNIYDDNNGLRGMRWTGPYYLIR